MAAAGSILQRLRSSSPDDGKRDTYGPAVGTVTAVDHTAYAPGQEEAEGSTTVEREHPELKIKEEDDIRPAGEVLSNEGQWPH